MPMGAKEKSLKHLLAKHNVIEISSNASTFNVAQVLFGEWKDEIYRVYKSLGGMDDAYAFRGKFDIITPQYIIELDEQLHFNDYRLTTLLSPVYEQLEFFPLTEYRQYCADHKEGCLRVGSFGSKWTSSSCEKMFGPSAATGDLSGNGSPRWKQRAFYDFVKDVSFLVTGIPVVRLSIYDSIGNTGREMMLGDVLENSLLQSASTVEGIKTLIEKRLGLI